MQVGDQGRQVLQQSLQETASRYAERQVRSSPAASEQNSPGPSFPMDQGGGDDNNATSLQRQLSAAANNGSQRALRRPSFACLTESYHKVPALNRLPHST